ncbi:hypothetical protein [Streptomyces sp. NPDC047981]|uniref:hypothetical protein n=1 Tax=Streptomyces sp. NPDC047981 TaxID=3154610 RepID=UPI00344718BE
MAADTAPAAVPDPNDRPHQDGQPGLWASMLAPVEPARPAPATFNLDPAAGTPGTQQGVAGVSSASFHGDDNTPENAPNSTSNSRRQESVMRAWLLAGAERWRKGAGAGVKRLEVEKARAAAQQVRETRTVTVNRTVPGPNTAGSGGGGGGNRPAKTPKTPAPAPRTGPRNTSNGGGGASRTPAPAPAPAPRSSRAERTPRTPAAPTPATTNSTRREPGPRPHNTRTPGQDGGSRTPGNRTPAPSGASGAGGTTPRTPGPAPVRNSAGRGTSDPRARKNTPDTSTAERRATPERRTTPETDRDPNQRATSTSSRRTNRPDADGQERRPTSPAQTNPGTPNTTRPSRNDRTDRSQPRTTETTRPLGTRGSRETGYRDGARAARAAAHVQAYADGVKDGWADVQDTARQEKTALDTAHAARKQQRDKDTPVPPTQTIPPKPTRPPATPIPVTGVDAASVHLGDGANRTALARGEVRTLKKFQRRLEAKTETMQQVAERSRGLETHATQQAEAITRLLEAAKGVKGGEDLLATLARLQDAANAQAGLAGDVSKRAVRGADACSAVHANAQTRYGGIYQAVVDSPLTKPAEGDFYKEG